jgi:imidazolonepropionase-like amidohydrolase
MLLRPLTLFAASIFLASPLFAQRPVPALPQKSAILILGATAHLGNGQTIANSAIGFENGKLTLVADATVIRLDRSKYGKIYDAAGKHVYPGFIAPDTRIGLVEIDAVRATVDFSDLGGFMPNLRVLSAYNTDSELIPTIRSNGILLAQVTPEGGVISGSSSVVQLDAWNWEDAAYRSDDGIWLSWPAQRSFGGFGSGAPEFKKNEQYDKDVLALRNYFEEAQAYAKQLNPAVKNLKFEAMRGLFDKKQSLYVRSNNAKTIQEAVLFAESFGLKVVIGGGQDSWMVADFLKSHNVPVILGLTQALPARDDDDIDQTFKTATQLYEKGVLFAFTSNGSWRQRNLPFQAGQACGFGLPKEAAVSALTLNTAKILGIDQTCGSLESGKDATLFISEGDALDMRGCIVTAAFIQGREINLDNKHKQLGRRFEEKYRR